MAKCLGWVDWAAPRVNGCKPIRKCDKEPVEGEEWCAEHLERIMKGFRRTLAKNMKAESGALGVDIEATIQKVFPGLSKK